MLLISIGTFGFAVVSISQNYKILLGGLIMTKRHFSDVLFDYLAGSLHVSFSDEETENILKAAKENLELQADDSSLETKKD